MPIFFLRFCFSVGFQFFWFQLFLVSVFVPVIPDPEPGLAPSSPYHPVDRFFDELSNFLGYVFSLLIHGVQWNGECELKQGIHPNKFADG